MPHRIVIRAMRMGVATVVDDLATSIDASPSLPWCVKRCLKVTVPPRPGSPVSLWDFAHPSGRRSADGGARPWHGICFFRG